MQGTMKQCYGVIGLEPRRTKNIYPWITDGMLYHQMKKLKKSQKKGVAIRELGANAVVQHETIEEKELESVRKQQATSNKHTTEYLTNKDRAEIVFATKKQPKVLLIAELKAVVKWKKRKGDAAIPSTKCLLLQRYVERINRPDLTLAQTGSQTAT